MKAVFFTILLIAAAASGQTKEKYEERGIHINGTTSPFTRIIKTDDIRIKDPTFVTPALMFVGKRNGDVVRCLQDDPMECEVFYRTEEDSIIYSMLVHGEYIYVGTSRGEIMRCDLNKINDTCLLLHKFEDSVVSLFSTRGYLYAGVRDQIIARCDLYQPNDCQVVHKLENTPYSLIEFEDHLYAGLNMRLMRCSLRTDSCHLVANMTEVIMGLAVVNKSLIAATNDGFLWNCTRKGDAADNFCVSAAMGKSDVWDIAIYNGVIYANNEEGVYSCKFARLSRQSDLEAQCTTHGDFVGAKAIAFVYSTYQMQGHYKTEEVACAWQSSYKCPPFVNYYEPRQRATLEVHVKDGKLRNSVGDLVDTTGADEGKNGSAAIFVMGPEGRLLLSNVHVHLLLHTSSLLAGGPVAGAGELVVEDGIIKKMTTCSKHYRPTLELNRQVVASLRWQGYTEPIDLQECFEEAGESSLN